MAEIIFGIVLILLGIVLHKYICRSEIEDREDKGKEKGIAVMMICGGVFWIVFYLVILASKY